MAWLRDALDLLSLQWRPAQGTLVFDGAGLGLGWVRASLRRLADLFGPTSAADIASGVLPGPQGPCALRRPPRERSAMHRLT